MDEVIIRHKATGEFEGYDKDRWEDLSILDPESYEVVKAKDAVEEHGCPECGLNHQGPPGGIEVVPSDHLTLVSQVSGKSKAEVRKLVEDEEWAGQVHARRAELERKAAEKLAQEAAQ